MSNLFTYLGDSFRWYSSLLSSYSYFSSVSSINLLASYLFFTLTCFLFPFLLFWAYWIIYPVVTDIKAIKAENISIIMPDLDRFPPNYF